MSSNGTKAPERPQKYVNGVLMDCSDEDIAQIEADKAAAIEPAAKPAPQEQPHGQRRTK
jgi:cytochrome c553